MNTARGFSLVELMVAMALGLVVMSGALSIFTATVRANAEMLKTTRLQEEMAAAAAYMEHDIRRAGSAPALDMKDAADTPFATLRCKDRDDNGHCDCILYRYDYDRDNMLDDGSETTVGEHPDERLGFRLDADHGAIERRRSGRDCDGSRWEDLTDPRTVRITALEFELATDTTPLPGDETLTTRSLIISLTGHLTGDASVEHTLRRRVRIRNDTI